MRNTIRCCISCILPCGALDVIRIVHVDGRVEEIGGTVSAAEIMKAYPKHILKKPTTRFPADADVAAPRIVVVPPDAELKRGKIYFLIPVTSNSSAGKKKKREAKKSPSQAPEKIKNVNGGWSSSNNCIENGTNNTERYLSEILREKASTQKERRRGRVGVWRPHLESICESAIAAGDD